MTAIPEFLTTKCARPAEQARVEASAACLLVRVYPLEEMERPVELSAAARLIGREQHCTLQLADESVSRRHAMLEYDGRTHVVTDLGSTNGTYVNEQRVTGSRPLAAGDRVRFGNQIFKYLTADGIEAQYHEVVFKMMTTDGLTSAYNKRYFLETLERELQQSQRSASPLCVMMADLDRFKSINDTYGHLAGDTVLVEFARRARSVLRGGELLARYGGEEFVLLLTRATLEEAAVVAERMREIVAAEPARFESTFIPMTVSIGIACFDGVAVRDSEELLAEADQYLYAAKRAGRNQVQYPREAALYATV